MKLYKYQAINKNSISALIQRSLWSSKPSLLNDPFEFKLMNLSEEDLSRCKGIDKLRERNPDLKYFSDYRVAQLAIDQLQKTFNKMGVISFTEVNDDLLMWAHYGDNHYGMCLGFEYDTDKIDGPWIQKVYYPKDNEYPEIDLDNIWHLHGTSKIMHTKSKQWEYEKEWRTFHTEGNQLRPYPIKLIQVIFGSRTSQSDKVVIKNILKSEEIEFKQARLHDCEYKIVID